jgi:SEC-C motif-containing protein
MNLQNNPERICPCGSGKKFANCCYPIIENYSAQSPEQLMRSRYSAYSLGEYQYILNTYHSSTRPNLSVLQFEQDSKGTQWIKLRVLDASKDGTRGSVEFKAISKEQGKVFCLHENSRFTFEDSKWFYVDGDIQDDSGLVKLGRNEPCICGSEQKFKRCCGR